MMISETPSSGKAKSRSSIAVDSLNQTGARLTSRVKDGWERLFLDTKRGINRKTLEVINSNCEALNQAHT